MAVLVGRQADASRRVAVVGVREHDAPGSTTHAFSPTPGRKARSFASDPHEEDVALAQRASLEVFCKGPCRTPEFTRKMRRFSMAVEGRMGVVASSQSLALQGAA